MKNLTGSVIKMLGLTHKAVYSRMTKVADIGCENLMQMELA